MGSLDSRSSEKAAVLMAALIFIIIGPAFAAPRTGLVAYEMAVKPFFVEASQAHLTAFSVIFLRLQCCSLGSKAVLST